MFEGLTLGSYLPGNSFLHKLDPRTKIIASLVLITGTLAVSSPAGYLVFSLVMLLLVNFSGLSWPRFFRGLHLIYFIVLLGFLVQSVTVPGDPVAEIMGLTFTRQGVKSGGLLCWRLTVIIIISSLVTFTTTPVKLSAGLEKLIRPLGRLGLPVEQIAMMMGLVIGFIPVMLGEMQAVITSQRSRGADFGGISPWRRLKSLLPLLVPVVAGILRRADDLSEAMEARCYRPGAHRTRMNELHFQWRDRRALIGTFTLVIVSVLAGYL